MPRPLLGRGPLWFDSCKRPLCLYILDGRLREARLCLMKYTVVIIQWNPNFSNHVWKSKLVRIFGRFEKSGVKFTVFD